MLQRLKTLPAAIKNAFQALAAMRHQRALDPDASPTESALPNLAARVGRVLPALLVAAGAGGAVYILVTHPPLQAVPRGEVALRTNQLSGAVSIEREGSFVVVPGLHRVRSYPLRDKSYRPEKLMRADGPSPLQSVEGLSLGLDLTVRWSLDQSRLADISPRLPDDVEADLIEPAIQAVVYKLISRHTVREIFSSQRAEIAQAIETELRTRLAVDGVLLRGVQMGSIDLPADYRKGMDHLLADSLASERMRYTLEIADKRVKETEFVAAADKLRRETAAEAAGREQVIAAKAQEEAMQHVLPYKQRQIEQRRLEAEAENTGRIKMAEGAARARRIEVEAEANARQRLADAEAYRAAKLGRVNAEQMAVEGDLITRHPLLIQKAMADKLSDKVQVIIASPPAAGGFIGNALLGVARPTAPDRAESREDADAAKE